MSYSDWKKLSQTDKREKVKYLFANGAKPSAIAEMYGVGCSYIYFLLSGKKAKTGYKPSADVSAHESKLHSDYMKAVKATEPPECRSDIAAMGGNKILTTRGKEYFAELGRKSAKNRAKK